MALTKNAKLLNLIWILLILGSPVLAQDQDSLAYVFRQDNLFSGNDLQLKYHKDFQNMSWQFTDLVRYKLYTFENSMAQGKQYSIEHQLRSDLMWGDRRSRSIRLESNQYQDHRTFLASQITNQAVLAGYKYHEIFSFYLGGRSIERYGLLDQGWTTEADFRNSWRFQNQAAALSVSGSRDDLNEHSSHSSKSQADYEINFGQASRVKTGLAYENRDQSFYTDSLGSSQSRVNENLRWQTHFVYRLNDDLSLYHQLGWENQLTEITQRKINLQDTVSVAGESRERFALSNESGLSLERERFTSNTALKLESSQNKYYVDYTQRLYQLRQDLAWMIPGFIDSLEWNTVLSRLEYDTPDTTNDDDRDELRFNTELRLVWRPSPFYMLELGSKTSLFHLIYLFNSRSSENHWNRNMLLWSGLVWSKGKWGGESRGRVRSNYFDYDYDDLFLEMEQPARSFVHRSLDLQQSLQFHFSKRWSIDLKYSAKWEDEGQLNWSAFIQQIRSEREQTEIVYKLFYDYRGWKGWIGYLEHDRLTRYTDANRQAENWHGTGPLMGLQHTLGGHLYLNADARFIQVVDQDREYLLPKVYFTLVYR